MKKFAKGIIIVNMFTNIFILSGTILMLLTGEKLEGNVDGIRTIYPIVYPLMNIYIFIYINKYMNSSINLTTLVNKISEYFVVVGILRVIINMIYQYITYQKITSIFTEMDTFAFVCIGLVLKLCFKIEERKRREHISGIDKQ